MDKSDKKKVRDIESLLLNDKPWQLKGEIGAHARPTNSLLFEDVNFEQRVKAPVITQEVKDNLEIIIRQRIKEGKYDDPIRKVKKSIEASNREIEVSAEKSKVGLAQLYEQELLSKVSEVKATDGPERIVERKLAALCRKLDALSNG